MTDQEISELGPAFSTYLRPFRDCFLQDQTAAHFDTYCRGLLAPLPRKSVEPIALESGTAVRTLQLFLTDAHWGHFQARDTFQSHLAQRIDFLPSDRLGTIGTIDETSAKKQGRMTPGVQRQYLGCAGKVDNGIVTVHFGVTRGRFSVLLDADLFLPQSWDDDRDRCARAGIPDEIGYRPKWRIAFDQLLRLDAAGHHFDWLVFDEGYGSKVPFLTLLSLAGQRFVAEVPVNFSVRHQDEEAAQRADEALTADDARAGQRIRIPRQTGPDQYWRATSLAVRVAQRDYVLIVAINEATAEVKYFVSNAVDEPLRIVLLVAFRRATIEHDFRVAKEEAGLMHFEGRSYVGLMRHLILALIVMGFVAIHTDQLRGEKSGGDEGAGLSSVEHPLRDVATPSPRHLPKQSRWRSHPLSSAPQRSSHSFAQTTAA